MRKTIVWLIFSLVAVPALASCGEEKNRTAKLFDQESEKNGYYFDLETTSEGENLHLKIHIKGDFLYMETIINGSKIRTDTSSCSRSGGSGIRSMKRCSMIL